VAVDQDTTLAIKIQELSVEAAVEDLDTANLLDLGAEIAVFVHLLQVLADKDFQADMEYIGQEHRLDRTMAVVAVVAQDNLDTIALDSLIGKAMMVQATGPHKMKVSLTVLDLAAMVSLVA
jgi:hypothetical protein